MVYNDAVNCYNHTASASASERESSTGGTVLQPKYSEKNPYQDHFTYKNPTWTNLTQVKREARSPVGI